MKRPTGQFMGNDEDEMNRILSQADEILPSSGFAASVMDAVRREAAAPPPIPFPWKRALPGLAVGGLMLVLVLRALLVAMAHAVKVTAPQFMSLPSGMPPLFHGGIESAAIWAALALLTALVSVKLTMRLAFSRI